jgi:hypothetical protein
MNNKRKMKKKKIKKKINKNNVACTCENDLRA